MPQALTMTRGKTAVFHLTVVQSDGTTPQDLTGLTVYFHAIVGGVTLAKESPGDGIVITDAVGGLATVTIDPADTAGVPSTGVYQGPFEVVVSNGTDAYNVDSGTLTISPNVGTP